MQELIKTIKEEIGGKFFSVSFIKKDGTLREMTCRLGVTKHLKGGELKHNPSDFGHLVVFDLQKQAYRTINLNTLKKIKLDKKEYNF
jgi:hypothetical protein